MDKLGVVIDTNCIKVFIHDEELDIPSSLWELIDTIMRKCGLAINKIIEYEWRQRTSNHYKYWFEENYKKGYIYCPKLNQKLSAKERNTLIQKHGFPNSRDIHYIQVAINTQLKYILTQDMHFYEPKMKLASGAEKDRIREKRTGGVCRYLKKELEITVGMPDHCRIELKNCCQ